VSRVFFRKFAIQLKNAIQGVRFSTPASEMASNNYDDKRESHGHGVTEEYRGHFGADRGKRGSGLKDFRSYLMYPGIRARLIWIAVGMLAFYG
jgi:hypothetical protein